MAASTGELVEVVKSHIRTGCWLMAINTGDCHVASGERERGGLVLCQSKAGRLECGAVVTLLAVVIPRSGGKLALVFILVAIDTKGELDLVSGLLAGRNMARGATYFLVREDEWETGFRVIGGRK